MNGLVPGRIVYFVFDGPSAAAVNQSRTGFMLNGTQAHIGNPVAVGDVLPAQVVRVWSKSGSVNLRVALDGNDTYWATSVPYAEWSPEAESLPALGTWHWMYSGQAHPRLCPVNADGHSDTPQDR